LKFEFFVSFAIFCSEIRTYAETFFRSARDCCRDTGKLLKVLLGVLFNEGISGLVLPGANKI